MVGLPIFGKEGSLTPVFKILVRALLSPKWLQTTQGQVLLRIRPYKPMSR